MVAGCLAGCGRNEWLANELEGLPVVRVGNGSRRDFRKGMAGRSAFVLGVSVLPKRLFAENRMEAALGPAEAMSKAPLQPNVYLAIDTDGTAYVIAHRSEMGNGVRASLPRIVA